MSLSGPLIAQLGIITPHFDRTEVDFDGRRLTYGEGPAGYDVRVEFDATGELQEIEMRPGDFILASTIEHFTMPSDVLGEVCDKSSWIRLGLSVHNTVIEPGWRGFLTLELKNEHPTAPIRIRQGLPIAQVIFHRVEGPVYPYTGKYQDQARGPQKAR